MAEKAYYEHKVRAIEDLGSYITNLDEQLGDFIGDDLSDEEVIAAQAVQTILGWFTKQLESVKEDAQDILVARRYDA